MEYTKQTGFYRDFPPEGTELVSWFVAMSFGFYYPGEGGAVKTAQPQPLHGTKGWVLFATKFIPPMTFNRLPRS